MCFQLLPATANCNPARARLQRVQYKVKGILEKEH